ncbi:hypothetical protein LINGRAHAP2_LOCUS18735 [Linum grandiflorum]
MASGSSSGRPSSGSKGFDFGSDDILCSYDDFPNQDSSNGTHSDPIPSSSPSKQGFEKSRMSRSSGYQAASYGQPDDSFHQEVISVVERSMKRHSDNMMRFLEGISSRLSQLELYCYNLDKSIGEMRSDLTRDHTETDTKLKAVEKHLQEVHRSVQILRDKQELAETQKELAKLQLVHKDSSSSTHSQSNEEKSAEPKNNDSNNNSEGHNQQLALALPQQVIPQQQQISVPPPSHTPPQNIAQPQPQPQPQSYYLPPSQSQAPPNHYMPPGQATQAPPLSSQQYPQYQQQWAQQVQLQQTQQPNMQSQVRPASNQVYPPYPAPGQPAGPGPQETLSSSMPMPASYSPVPQPSYGYGSARPVPQQQLPPQHPAYMVYEGEGGRAHHPTQTPHFAQGGYSPSNVTHPSSQPAPAPAPNMMPRNAAQSQFVRSHPYNELVEKLVNMGFRGDHVMSVIQRMEESGQPVDFNAVLDRLNVHSSGSPQRGWSG